MLALGILSPTKKQPRRSLILHLSRIPAPIRTPNSRPKLTPRDIKKGDSARKKEADTAIKDDVTW